MTAVEVTRRDVSAVTLRAEAGRTRDARAARLPAPGTARHKVRMAYIFGAACPGRGVAAGLVLPYADTGAMNAHLAEIARTVAPGAHAMLVLDGAG